MTHKVYTVSQFLEAFPVSRTTLYREWKEGRGVRRVRCGRRILIPAQAVDDWLNGRTDSTLHAA